MKRNVKNVDCVRQLVCCFLFKKKMLCFFWFFFCFFRFFCFFLFLLFLLFFMFQFRASSYWRKPPIGTWRFTKITMGRRLDLVLEKAFSHSMMSELPRHAVTERHVRRWVQLAVFDTYSLSNWEQRRAVDEMIRVCKYGWEGYVDAALINRNRGIWKRCCMLCLMAWALLIFPIFFLDG